MQHFLPNLTSGRRVLRGAAVRACLLLFLGLFTYPCLAQAPSHDPTSIVQNRDGRYWVFTTGMGIWAMSSSNQDFTDWRPEPTPFTPGTWPAWIDDYVPGFRGDFWAPGIIELNGYYYVYYSASSFGSSRSAIGVTRAQDLAGPWTDLGVVVSSDGSGSAFNAIDPALFEDNDGRVYMSYGSFFGGLAVVEIDPATGKTIGSATRIAGGNHEDREAPFIMKKGNYYYLFSNRGSCCRGANSTYFVVVSRSTDVRGPYTGERTFLSNRNENEIGPGHIGYGNRRLTYHYYDGDDNGFPKLMTRGDLQFRNGWPYLGLPTGGSGQGVVYQLKNRGTGMFLDGMGRKDNGSLTGQKAETERVHARWEIIDVGRGYSQLRNVRTGMYLDGMGNSIFGSDVAMWASTLHFNSHWSVQQFDGNFFRIQNRTTGLYLDGMGRTEEGAVCGQWGFTSHPNAQWELIPVNTTEELAAQTAVANLSGTAPGQATELSVFPNPVVGTLNVRMVDGADISTLHVYDISGKRMLTRKAESANQQVNVSHLPPGVYLIEATGTFGTQRTRFVKDN